MSFKPDCSHSTTIGFDLGGTSLKYGFGSRGEGLLYFNSINHTDKSLNGLVKLFESAIGDIKGKCNDFERLCVAAPGVIDAENGIILSSSPNLPFLDGVNLKGILEGIITKTLNLTLPAYIDNDANLMTLAEAHLCDSKSVLGITVGTGIGSGFVINNRIFHGENWLGMEAGHAIVVPNGRQCLCGKKGCLEAYASAESMKRIVCEQFPDFREKSISEILNDDLPEVKLIIRDVLDVFAVALANIVMVLNPGTLVIGGGVIEIEGYDFEHLMNGIYSGLQPDFRNFIIKKAEYGNRAGVMGAILHEQ